MLLTIEGDHVPMILLVEIAGNCGASLPEHIAAIGAKFDGIVPEITVIVKVVSLAHCPPAGVKV